MEINPMEGSKSIQDDKDFIHDIKISTIELALRSIRWRVLNLKKEEFENWILNVEPAEFLQHEVV